MLCGSLPWPFSGGLHSIPLAQTFRCPKTLDQGLLFWLFEGDFKASLGIVEWYRSSYGSDFDTSEKASPADSTMGSVNARFGFGRAGLWLGRVAACVFLLSTNLN